MVGMLIHGNNHFILSGPLRDEAAALALVRHWSIVANWRGEVVVFRAGRKGFESTWNGRSLSRATVKLLRGVTQLLARTFSSRRTIRRLSSGCW